MVIVVTASLLECARPFRPLVLEPWILPILVECQNFFDTHSIDESPISTSLFGTYTSYIVPYLRLLAYLRFACRQCAEAVEGVRRMAAVVSHDVDVEPRHASSHKTTIPVAAYKGKPGQAAERVAVWRRPRRRRCGRPARRAAGSRPAHRSVQRPAGTGPGLRPPAPPPPARRSRPRGNLSSRRKCLVSALQRCLVRCRLVACPKRRTWRSRSEQLADKHGVSADLIRQGTHEIWECEGLTFPIPRHRDIAEGTAREIIKTLTEHLEHLTEGREDNK